MRESNRAWTTGSRAYQLGTVCALSLAMSCATVTEPAHFRGSEVGEVSGPGVAAAVHFAPGTQPANPAQEPLTATPAPDVSAVTPVEPPPASELRKADMLIAKAREDAIAEDQATEEFQAAEAMVKRFKAVGRSASAEMTLQQVLTEKFRLKRELETIYDNMNTNGSAYWETAIAYRKGDLDSALARMIRHLYGPSQMTASDRDWIARLEAGAIAHYEAAVERAQAGYLNMQNQWVHRAVLRLETGIGELSDVRMEGHASASATDGGVLVPAPHPVTTMEVRWGPESRRTDIDRLTERVLVARAREHAIAEDEAAAEFEEAELMFRRFKALGRTISGKRTPKHTLGEKQRLMWDIESFYDHMYTNGSSYWEIAIACRRGDLYYEMWMLQQHASDPIVLSLSHRLSTPSLIRNAKDNYKKALRLARADRTKIHTKWTRRATRRLQSMRPCNPGARLIPCNRKKP